MLLGATDIPRRGLLVAAPDEGLHHRFQSCGPPPVPRDEVLRPDPSRASAIPLAVRHRSDPFRFLCEAPPEPVSVLSDWWSSSAVDVIVTAGLSTEARTTKQL